jgi:transposase
MKILPDIIKGERDPQELAMHKHARIQASRAEIARRLEGTWRPELLFVLEQSLELYDTYLEKMAACDGGIDEHLKTTLLRELRRQLYRITGVDVTQIDGVDVPTAQTVIAEVGVDMSRWKSEKQFASRLGLCPDNRSGGGKVLKRGMWQVVNRASTAL